MNLGLCLYTSGRGGEKKEIDFFNILNLGRGGEKEEEEEEKKSAMFNRIKLARSSKRRIILVSGIWVLLLWVVFVVVHFSSLPSGRESPDHVDMLEYINNAPRSVNNRDGSFSSQKTPQMVHDKDYLKVTEEVHGGEKTPFGSASERNVSPQPIDIVLNLDGFNTKPGSAGLYSMLVMFFVRSIEKYLLFFSPHGKIHVLLPDKNGTTFSEWRDGRVAVVGYDEIFPSPENNLPNTNPNAVKANLRNVPNVSSNFIFFDKLTFLKDFLSITKILTPDEKIKICK